mmetsp:Transcript_50547/g.99023  ORF Transcript_50547/g.99023 Transcript_50547/m.99023 type:complete len:201 (+) Transcript_50547:611-1213(+)
MSLEPGICRCSHRIRTIHTSDVTKHPIPVRNTDNSSISCASNRLRNPASPDCSIGSDATFPVRILASFERKIICASRFVGCTAVVSHKHNQSVVPHFLRFELFNNNPNSLIHVIYHGSIPSPICVIKLCRGYSLVNLVQVCQRYVQRRVNQVEGVEVEERNGRVVAVQDVKCVLFELKLLVTLRVGVRAVFTGRVQGSRV